MNRKQYMDSLGATCVNHQFSWSFVDHTKRILYFGSWDHERKEDGGELIFSLDWEYHSNGSKSKGFKQSSDHIDLIEFQKYKLKTFTMIAKNPAVVSPIKIKRIVEGVRGGHLRIVDGNYYSYAEPSDVTQRISPRPLYMEGALNIGMQSFRERNPEARKACLEIYGFACRVCEFNFKEGYGKLGAGYIHVHHLELISKKDGVHEVNPTRDLRPVCPNCHAIIHKRKIPYTINEMRQMIGKTALENP